MTLGTFEVEEASPFADIDDDEDKLDENKRVLEDYYSSQTPLLSACSAVLM